MPICITCSTPVKNLYTTYSKADDRALGKGVRLTQCPNCKRFADKYVEHDFVVLFIDLVLIKPQVYRHLLFNRLGRSDNKLDPTILRLGALLVLFDVYITWARIERSNESLSKGKGSAATWALADASIVIQYLFFLTMNVLATVAQHGVIRFLSKLLLQRQERSRKQYSPQLSIPGEPDTVRPGEASPAAITTALLISSGIKLFPILLVIWPTTESDSNVAPHRSIDKGFGKAFVSNASDYVGWAVLLNNIEALLILLDCGYIMATSLALAGLLSRWIVESWALGMVGLKNPGSRELSVLSDVVALVKAWFA